ncbi:hypothetical protein LCGC14_2854430 [marine sediment metagenome]|uniref:Uncharacterized protein n=1 Tax=marine sediment metagenome TaxID=412755 RepID=A0A0F9AYG1_9ZZZZ
MVERVEQRLSDVEDIGGNDAELMRIARDRYQLAVDHDQDNRDAGIEDLEFMAGDQWPEEIRRERNEDGRVILTINRMPAFVNQIINDIRQNRPSIKVRPVDDTSDDAIADIYTGLIRHIEHASDAMVAYVTAMERRSAASGTSGSSPSIRTRRRSTRLSVSSASSTPLP